MSFRYLHRYPFLRLLLPLIAGFLVGNYLFFKEVYVPDTVLVGVSAGLFFLLLAVYFSRRYSFRWIFGSVAYLLVFGAGTGGMNQVLQQTIYAFPKQECVYRAILTDWPDEKEHTFLCPAFLTEKQDSVGVVPVNRKVLLYISKDSLAGSLHNGDELVLMARVSPPSNNGNPDEFDYARYLRYRGIGGVAFVAEGNGR